MVKRIGMTCWSCILLVLMLAMSVSAQAPTGSFERAIKELQAEIESTRAEVKALRIQQEKQLAQERKAREQEARRAKAQQRAEARDTATTRRLAKKNAELEIRATENHRALEHAELVLAELGSVDVAKEPARAEQQKVIAALVVERNALREKIRKANRRWTCRVLHIGCIGKR